MNYSDRDNGALSRLAIALAVHSLDPSLFGQLITSVLFCFYTFHVPFLSIRYYPFPSFYVRSSSIRVCSFTPYNLPLFPLLRVPRKVMEFLQPLIVRYNDEGIALRQFQIGSRVIFKPARPDSDRNCNQSGSILDICLTKCGSD